MNDAEQQAMIAECIAFDLRLKEHGHFAGGVALQGAGTATTLRWKDGKTSQTDGPFAETKELLGGILILEAKDKDEALSLMSRHPGVRIGPFEVRPADEAFMAQHPVLKSL
ncbi:MAG: YciI family protein [Steroidobacteraceae bacterium]